MRSWLLFVLGFLVAAMPLLIINTLEYRNPFSTGISKYLIGEFVFEDSLDWTDFPGTYDAWPLTRLITERPRALVRRMYDEFWQIFKIREGGGLILAAVLVLPFVFVNTAARRELAALLWMAVAYTVAVMLPTRVTERAELPVTIIAAVLVACALGCAWSRRRTSYALFAVTVVALAVVNWPLDYGHNLQLKWERMSVNRQAIALLRQQGLRNPDQLFTNDWGLLNLDDPKFVTFVNWGGWILLDTKYAIERPLSRATTALEWAGYFAQQQIDFVVLQKDGPGKVRIASIVADPAAAGLVAIQENANYLFYQQR